VEEKLHAELATVLNGRTPTVADIPNLVYSRMIIDEVLRLYSPVAIMARDPLEDDVIDGYKVQAGSLVTVTPFLTHRHPEFWDNSEGFLPERFAPELESKRPRYAYYPFGAGSRVCLGQHFALLEGVLILADVAQRYRLQAVPGLQVQPEFVGALRPCGAPEDASPGRHPMNRVRWLLLVASHGVLDVAQTLLGLALDLLGLAVELLLLVAAHLAGSLLDLALDVGDGPLDVLVSHGRTP
jgi:hypothetical protein